MRPNRPPFVDLAIRNGANIHPETIAVDVSQVVAHTSNQSDMLIPIKDALALPLFDYMWFEWIVPDDITIKSLKDKNLQYRFKDYFGSYLVNARTCADELVREKTKSVVPQYWEDLKYKIYMMASFTNLVSEGLFYDTARRPSDCPLCRKNLFHNPSYARLGGTGQSGQGL